MDGAACISMVPSYQMVSELTCILVGSHFTLPGSASYLVHFGPLIQAKWLAVQKVG